jgi:bifunctional DNA-binding transcriptional regulator/antitoxin component of YhaV-PrlF toxin-antitoxin module
MSDEKKPPATPAPPAEEPPPVREALGRRTGDRVLFRVHRDRVVLAEVPDFLELAGSVPVPGKKGSSWSRIRGETWRKRARARR